MVISSLFLQMALTVCTCQVVCRAPSLFIAAYSVFTRTSAICPVWVEFLASLLAKTSTALTPLAQLSFTRQFRRCLIRCCCCRSAGANTSSSIPSLSYNSSMISSTRSAECSVCLMDGNSAEQRIHRHSSRSRVHKASSPRPSTRSERRPEEHAMTVARNPGCRAIDKAVADQMTVS